MGGETKARALRYAGCAGVEVRNRVGRQRAASDPTRATDKNLAFVALGSNVGDSARIIREAFRRLAELADGRLRKSSLWQTTPVDCPPGSPRFLNAVAAFVPHRGESPESLLAKLQALERKFGRQPKKVANEPRPLDLDLIAFGTEVRSKPELTLPHPRAHQRRFVLQPLSEIAPGLVLPGQSKTVARLLSEQPPDIEMRLFGGRKRDDEL